MARRPSLSSLSLSPFGGAGVDFGAFSLVDNDRAAYLAFLKVEVEWEAGRKTDTEYLDALRAYGAQQTQGTSDYVSVQARIEQTTYRIERNKLLDEVQSGAKPWADLLAYDESKLTGLNQDSQEYRQRLDLLYNTQQAAFADEEEKLAQQYQLGQMTATQLLGWYREKADDYAGNTDLNEQLGKRIIDFTERVQDERDRKMLDDYNDGKVGVSDFLVYAKGAQARYAVGTEAYDAWGEHLNDAKQTAIEESMNYRYGLSQEYYDLEKFVKSVKAPTGGVSKGTTSSRTVLGADGKWHTVTSRTPGKAYGPSKSEQAAYKKALIQVNEAKKRMKEIEQTMNSQPGGWVSSKAMYAYYADLQGDYVKGTSKWYAIQEKMDNLRGAIHQETVVAKSGIKVSYPPTKSGSAPTYDTAAPASSSQTVGTAGASSPAKPSGGGVTIDQFMRAIAKVESGGRYDARNKNSGAYGKYQILPSNWPSWAKKYLGDANAAPTPANQEKVAKGRMLSMYKAYGSWEAVAHAWLTGAGAGKEVQRDPSRWSASSTNYVNKVLHNLGLGPVSRTGGQTRMPSTASSSGGGSYAGAAASKPSKPQVGQDKSNIDIIVGVEPVASPVGRRERALQYDVRDAGLPKGLDSRDFEGFYAGMRQAFLSGEDSYTDYSSGKAVTYYIAPEAGDRMALMNELDQMRLDLYKEQASAYHGTSRAITAGKNYNRALHDTVENAYAMLDTQGIRLDPKTGKTISAGSTDYGGTIGIGLNQLEMATSAIEQHQQHAADAWARGDINAAMSYYQLAADAASGSYLRAITENALKATAEVNRLKQTGVPPPDMLVRDLEKLQTAGDTLSKALEGGDKGLTEMWNFLKKDANGNPVRDRATGTWLLADNTALILNEDGTITPKKLKSTGFNDPAHPDKQTFDLPDAVPVLVHNGSTNVTAYSKYTVGNVGWAKTPGGDRVPLTGRVVTYTDPKTGKTTTWGENPFKPGQWLPGGSTFVVPKSFNTVTDPNTGNIRYEFSITPKTAGTDIFHPQPAQQRYVLSLDAKKGTYNIIPLPNDGSDPTTSMPMTDAAAQRLMDEAGFTYDRSALSAEQRAWLDAKTNGAVFGQTPDQYKTFRYGPPRAKAEASRANVLFKAKTTGERNLDKLDTDLPKTSSTPKAVPIVKGPPSTGVLGPPPPKTDATAWYAEQNARVGATKTPSSDLFDERDTRAAATTTSPLVKKVPQAIAAKPKPKPKPKPKTPLTAKGGKRAGSRALPTIKKPVVKEQTLHTGITAK